MIKNEPKLVDVPQIINDATKECATIMALAMDLTNSKNHIKTKSIFNYDGNDYNLTINVDKI